MPIVVVRKYFVVSVLRSKVAVLSYRAAVLHSIYVTVAKDEKFYYAPGRTRDYQKCRYVRNGSISMQLVLIWQ